MRIRYRVKRQKYSKDDSAGSIFKGFLALCCFNIFITTSFNFAYTEHIAQM